MRRGGGCRCDYCVYKTRGMPRDARARSIEEGLQEYLDDSPYYGHIISDVCVYCESKPCAMQTLN